MSSKLRSIVPLASLAILAAVSAPAAAQPEWVFLGPEKDQHVQSVAVLPGAPSPVLAAGLSGVYRSFEGEAWELPDVADDLPTGDSGVLYAGRVAGPVYLEAERLTGGLYRGDDPGSAGGPHWTLVREEGIWLDLVAVAPGDPSRVYLSRSFEVDLGDGELGMEWGLELSLDGGETWSRGATFSESASTSGFGPDALAISHQSPDVVYAVVAEFGVRGVPDFVRLLRSDDGGVSWQLDRDLGLPTQRVRDAEVNPGDDSVLYVALDSALYRITESGLETELVTSSLPSATGPERDFQILDLEIDPVDPSTLYLATEHRTDRTPVGGVYRSEDAGATWVPASEGLPLPMSVESLALDPDAPNAIWAGTPRGVFQSTDGGRHWNATPDRLPTPVETVALGGGSAARLFAGGSSGRLFSSGDGGLVWRRIGEELPPPLFDTFDLPIDVLATTPADPDVVFAHGFSSQSIGRSTDGGESWTVLDPPPFGDVTGVSVDPRNANRVVASVGTAGGLFLSLDRGETWSKTRTGKIGLVVRAPSDPDVLYAGAETTSPAVFGTGGVCRSGDAGATWACALSDLPAETAVRALAVDPHDASTVFAALLLPGSSDSPLRPTLHRSVDGATTWSPVGGPGLPDGVAPFDLLVDPRSSDALWAATLQGVFRSADGGRTWEPRSEGLTHPYVLDLEYDPSGRVLLAATWGGMFRFSANAGPAPPPELPWISDPALPGFRIKVRIAQGDDPPISGTLEPECIPETVCLSGALRGRSEVFVRIVGPKPNGFLWPTLVKFTTSRVEVWIQQLSTGELRYYVLRGASPGFDELPGLFDREGFLPE